jgi:hypothetical protein
MDRLIIGVGTGRCGTKSLTRLLAGQPQTSATHERYGHRVRWGCPPALWPLRLWQDTGRAPAPVQAEVAFYWVPQVRAFLRWGDATERPVRVVGLRRGREATIASYLRWKQNGDHWRRRTAREEPPEEWDHCYPSYDETEKAAAIGRFWDDVYGRLAEIRDERLRVFPTEALNDPEGVEAILRHCGYDRAPSEEEVGIQIQSPSIEEARNSTQW